MTRAGHHASAVRVACSTARPGVPAPHPRCASPGGAIFGIIARMPHRRICGSTSASSRGEWTLGRGAVRLNKSGGRIAYRFHARNPHLVRDRRSRKLPCGSG